MKHELIMENWRKYLLKEYPVDRGGGFSADAIVATAASGDTKGAVKLSKQHRESVKSMMSQFIEYEYVEAATKTFMLISKEIALIAAGPLYDVSHPDGGMLDIDPEDKNLPTEEEQRAYEIDLFKANMQQRDMTIDDHPNKKGVLKQIEDKIKTMKDAGQLRGKRAKDMSDVKLTFIWEAIEAGVKDFKKSWKEGKAWSWPNGYVWVGLFLILDVLALIPFLKVFSRGAGSLRKSAQKAARKTFNRKKIKEAEAQLKRLTDLSKQTIKTLKLSPDVNIRQTADRAELILNKRLGAAK